MGLTGSITAKATVNAFLKPFTAWGEDELAQLLERNNTELADTFALRFGEFEILVGRNSCNYQNLKSLFSDLFDTDGNKLVDKFEVLCVLGMASTLSVKKKVEYFFDIFNFNAKGYLTKSEISLMIKTVSKGMYKADKSPGCPNDKILDAFVAAVLSYARCDETKQSIRKPELVVFSANTVEVRGFLESWRGVASQVLLPEGVLWRDPFFTASQSSITPSDLWLRLGLPPEQFVRWRRTDKVGEGCTKLFSHVATILKTPDKRVMYCGTGLLGDGYFRQGLLSDRWLLNALAVAVVRPKVVEELFGFTGQEDSGRFCVRFFEGGGSRALFVDNRIPCSVLCEPLFSSSSDPMEYWPLLVEKAAAKYLRSYGDLAKCGLVPDSTMMAIRWITGGHVLRACTEDFDWKSMRDEVEGADGLLYIEDMLAEGSIVCLGRSETLSVGRSTLSMPPPRNPPPHGRLFPVVGVEESKGYKYLVLRDAWGLIPGITLVHPDPQWGFTRLFRIKCEDVLAQYDTLIVSRFPDSQRMSVEKIGLTPWRTELLPARTRGPKNPSRFVLTVLANNPRALTLAERARGKYKPDRKTSKFGPDSAADSSSTRSDDGATADIGRNATASTTQDRPVDIAITVSSAVDWAVAGSQEAGAKLRFHIFPSAKTRRELRRRRVHEIVRLKEMYAEKQLKLKTNADSASRVEYTEDETAAAVIPATTTSTTSAAVPTATSDNDGVRRDNNNDNNTAPAKAADTKREQSNVDEFVALSVGALSGISDVDTSAGAAGDSQKVLAKSVEEVTAEREKQSELDAKNKENAAALERRKVRDALMVRRKGINSRPSVRRAPIPLVMNSIGTIVNEEQHATETFDTVLSTSRCWISHSFNLFPGRYHILVDVETNPVPDHPGLKLNRDSEMAERPWAELDQVDGDGGEKLKSATAKDLMVRRKEKGKKNDKEKIVPISNSNASGGEAVHVNKEGNVVATQGVPIVSQTPGAVSEEPVNTDGNDEFVSIGAVNTEIKGNNGFTQRINREKHSKVSSANADKKQEKNKSAESDRKPKQRLKCGTSKLWIHASSTGKFGIRLSNKKSTPGDLKYVEVPEDKWPFLAEAQTETATRGLLQMTATLRREACTAEAVINTMLREKRSQSKKGEK